MKSLFTIHAGEFVTGEHIERKFRKVNVWLPSRDTGTDLLVTDAKNKTSVSLQVKFSRDFFNNSLVFRLSKAIESMRLVVFKSGENRKIQCRLLGVCLSGIRAAEHGFCNNSASGAPYSA